MTASSILWGALRGEVRDFPSAMWALGPGPSAAPHSADAPVGPGPRAESAHSSACGISCRRQSQHWWPMSRAMIPKPSVSSSPSRRLLPRGRQVRTRPVAMGEELPPALGRDGADADGGQALQEPVPAHGEEPVANPVGLGVCAEPVDERGRDARRAHLRDVLGDERHEAVDAGGPQHRGHPRPLPW